MGIVVELIMPVVVFLITLIVGFSVRNILFRRLARWAVNTKTEIDDILISALKKPFIIWCVMLGIYFALEYSSVSTSLVNIAGKVLLVLGVISVTMVVSGITRRLIAVYAKGADSVLPVTTLTQNVSRIVIFCIGILIILSSLGISITPILATLGVGGLAVALALQETLSNLFSGLTITAARQIRVGDYIKLNSGEEGYVTDINWRTTQIKMLPDNIVLVPNSKLAQAIVVNYHFPNKELTITVDAGVHYNSDLEKVEKITSEVAKEVMKEVPGGVPGFEPFIRYNTFGDYSVKFSVILRAKEFVDQYLIKHEFIKRLHARYQKEGIVIPYPVQAINYQQEKSTA